MKNLNLAIIEGRIKNNPEMFYDKTGNEIVMFSVTAKNVIINIITENKLASACFDFLKINDYVRIKGALKQYNNKTIILLADTVDYLTREYVKKDANKTAIITGTIKKFINLIEDDKKIECIIDLQITNNNYITVSITGKEVEKIYNCKLGQKIDVTGIIKNKILYAEKTIIHETEERKVLKDSYKNAFQNWIEKNKKACINRKPCKVQH